MDKIRVTRGEGCLFSRMVMEDFSDELTLGGERQPASGRAKGKALSV